MSLFNLAAAWEQSDAIDREEGALAYRRYNALMRSIADKHNRQLDRVVAAFVALSPNNDYKSNLRSLVSLLEGLNNGLPIRRITVSSYGHCKRRAASYLDGSGS